MARLESGVLVALQGRVSVDLGLRYREQLVLAYLEWPAHRVQHFRCATGSHKVEGTVSFKGEFLATLLNDDVTQFGLGL